MSSAATPVNGYDTPASSVSPIPHISSVPLAPPAHVQHGTPKTHHPKFKPVNVFSNDGSFLERFQHMKQGEEEKKKQEEMLATKQTFGSRFRSRGKRPLPPAESSNDATENPVKKARTNNQSINEYQKEVSSYAGRILKDHGTGVRPLVK